MVFSTTSTEQPLHFSTNKILWLFTIIFSCCWAFGWVYNHNMENYLIENLLVIIFIPILIFSYKWHRFSDMSFALILMFLLLHIYGAFYAYTTNAFGEWLKSTYHLWRNPYDRIVHFSFGLLIAYPVREILIRKFKVSKAASWLIPIEVAFSLGTIFEMIEWGVAELTTPEVGETYVATQGDVWDAHKDIILAALGAAVMMLIVFTVRSLRNKYGKRGEIGVARK